MFTGPRELFNFIFRHIVYDPNVYNKDYIYDELSSDLHDLFEHIKAIDPGTMSTCKKNANLCSLFIYTNHFSKNKQSNFNQSNFNKGCIWNPIMQEFVNKNVMPPLIDFMIELSRLVSPRQQVDHIPIYIQELMASYVIWFFHRKDFLKSEHGSEPMVYFLVKTRTEVKHFTLSEYFEDLVSVCQSTCCEELNM